MKGFNDRITVYRILISTHHIATNIIISDGNRILFEQYSGVIKIGCSTA